MMMMMGMTKKEGKRERKRMNTPHINTSAVYEPSRIRREEMVGMPADPLPSLNCPHPTHRQHSPCCSSVLPFLLFIPPSLHPSRHGSSPSSHLPPPPPPPLLPRPPRFLFTHLAGFAPFAGHASLLSRFTAI